MARTKRKPNVKRRFGSIRQRGQRFIVMYTGPDGNRHTPGKSFATEAQADLWLAKEETLVEHHRLGYTTWEPPKERNKKAEQKQVTVGEYLTAYNQRLADHGTIRASTYQQYNRVTENRITREDMVRPGSACSARGACFGSVPRGELGTGYRCVEGSAWPLFGGVGPRAMRSGVLCPVGGCWAGR